MREGRKKHTAARGDRTAVSAIIPDNDSNPNCVVAYLCLSQSRELRLLLTVPEATTIDSMWRRKRLGHHFLVGMIKESHKNLFSLVGYNNAM